MLRYIRTTLQLAVLSGAACEFDMDLPNLVIEYSDDRPGYEPEIVAVYVVTRGAKNPLPAWMIDAMGEQLVRLCRRHSETPASVLTALRDSVDLCDDDLAEVVARRDLPVVGLRAAE